MATALLPLLGGLGGLLGGLFGGNKTSGTSTTNSTSTPVYGAGQQALLNQLLAAFQGSTSPTSLNQFGQSYTNQGLANIQQEAGQASQSLQDVLASRGLARTGAGAAITAGNQYSSGQNIANFLNQAPITLANYKNSLLSSAGGFLSSLPVGSTTSSTTNQTGTVGPISALAGGITGGVSTAAGLYSSQQAQQSLANILNSINAQQTPLGTSGPGYGPNNVYGPQQPTASQDSYDDSADY